MSAQFYDGSGFAGGIPNLGLPRFAETDQFWFDPPVPPAVLDGNSVPTQARTRAVVQANHPTKLGTSIEFFGAGYTGDLTLYASQAQRLADICGWAHALFADQVIGHWAAWPAAVNGLGTNQLNLPAWQAVNDSVSSIILPSADYLAVEVYDQWGSTPTWVMAAQQEAAELRRLAGGKPIAAVIAPYHNFSGNNPELNSPLTNDDWSAQLATASQLYDWVILWLGWGAWAGEGGVGGLPFPNPLPWWYNILASFLQQSSPALPPILVPQPVAPSAPTRNWLVTANSGNVTGLSYLRLAAQSFPYDTINNWLKSVGITLGTADLQQLSFFLSNAGVGDNLAFGNGKSIVIQVSQTGLFNW